MVNRNTSNNGRKDYIEVDKLTKVRILVIKNPTIRSWYPYVNKTSLH